MIIGIIQGSWVGHDGNHETLEIFLKFWWTVDSIADTDLPARKHPRTETVICYCFRSLNYWTGLKIKGRIVNFITLVDHSLSLKME